MLYQSYDILDMQDMPENPEDFYTKESGCGMNQDQMYSWCWPCDPAFS